MGDLYRALGQGEKAREAFQSSLTIRERLAEAEPDRADFQRNLSVSYNKMGDLYRALGQGEKAREAFQSSLTIAKRLAEAEPDRADFQRDLSVSYERMGDLYRALGQGEKAREAFQSSLTIRERLAEAEPDRADFQVDLASSLVKVGLEGIGGRANFERALSILETLKSQGRLSPADEPKIEALRSLLDRLDNPDGVGSGSPG
jgi:tetratricopeptide (TPR) repeat protein